MKLADIVNGPWMIKPGMLEEIQHIYAVHMRGEKIDLKSVEAAIGRPLDNEPKPYQVENGTAIIPIQGVIAKKMNMFSRISGGTSSQQVQQNFQAALDDPYVDKILLDVDSPGGAVDGTFELADYIYNARGTKPITAFTNGQMASAAYLIASAADKRFISSEATDVGSIGVITKHTDVSKAQEMDGYKTTVLTAGKYKGTGHPYQPLSEEHQATMQGQLDHIYTAFVDTVSRNLGCSVEKCCNDMAEGREFIGSQAIKAGLVDGMSNMSDLCSHINSDSYRGAMAVTSNQLELSAENILQNTQIAGAGAPAAKGAATMDLALLKEHHPEAYQAALAEGMTIGATNERARIAAINSIPAAGHSDLVQAAIADGTSVAGDVALAIMTKEKAVRTGALADMISESVRPAASMEAVELSAEATELAGAHSVMLEAAKAKGRA